jgi:transcriptional regulator with GAF, ATPase, and Fis domain
MSRYNLRDVSERLTKSRTIESVISEFLRTLQAIRPDWRPSLAFYEVSRDSLVDVYELDESRLVRRNIVVPVERLPHRLVRKIFQANSPLGGDGDRGGLSSSKDSNACYNADPRDASELQPLSVLAEWHSCICLPLGYQDDLIAMLTVVSAKKNSFAGRALAEILPIKSVATVSLAQHLYRSARSKPQSAVPVSHPTPALEEPLESSEIQQEMTILNAESIRLDEESRARGIQIEALMQQIERLDFSSSSAKDELERVKQSVQALEEDAEIATEYLADAFHQLQTTQWTLEDLERTLGMVREAFQLLAEEQDPDTFPLLIVDWFSDHFAVDRCSLLVPDETGQTLTIGAQRGIPAEVANSVRVRLGRGVAGWVAAHRKPLYVRAAEDAQSLQRSPDGTYNSDSFIVVPLAHNGRLHAVLSLSNRTDMEGFTETDLDRANLAASVFAVTLGQRLKRGADSWA